MAATPSENAVQQHIEAIKADTKKLDDFLYAMPKGADLHTHHSGASLAENMIRYAKADNLCVDRKSFVVSANSICSPENLLANAEQNPTFYDAIIDAWSMRHFKPGKESGHDHFFAAFGKYGVISGAHFNDMLVEIIERAAQQNISYLELMVSLENYASGAVGRKIGWQEDLAQLREKLLNGGLQPIITSISTRLDANEAALQSSLQCGTEMAKAGCQVKLKYLYQILREKPPEDVFAQLLSGFEIANKESRIVGINMVQPEDGKLSMRDYSLHMRMISFLRRIYPNVKVSLHAGELAPDLVAPQGLRFHISEAVNVAAANRIGHGVDIMHENNMQQLLTDMAASHTMVEINLSSNEMILGIEGKNHPLPLYLSYGVPVALSTDDEGVSRAPLTEQYKKAMLTYHLSYTTIKTMARNSIAYSFLPGESLWMHHQYTTVATACSKDTLGADTLSSACNNFLIANEKARLQWDLEKKFVTFEKDFYHS